LEEAFGEEKEGKPKTKTKTQNKINKKKGREDVTVSFHDLFHVCRDRSGNGNLL